MRSLPRVDQRFGSGGWTSISGRLEQPASRIPDLSRRSPVLSFGQSTTKTVSWRTSVGYRRTRTFGSASAFPESRSNSHPCHGQERISPSRPQRYSPGSENNVVPLTRPRQTGASSWGHTFSTATYSPFTLKTPTECRLMVTIRHWPGAMSPVRATGHRSAFWPRRRSVMGRGLMRIQWGCC